MLAFKWLYKVYFFSSYTPIIFIFYLPIYLAILCTYIYRYKKNVSFDIVQVLCKKFTKSFVSNYLMFNLFSCNSSTFVKLFCVNITGIAEFLWIINFGFNFIRLNEWMHEWMDGFLCKKKIIRKNSNWKVCFSKE